MQASSFRINKYKYKVEKLHKVNIRKF